MLSAGKQTPHVPSDDYIAPRTRPEWSTWSNVVPAHLRYFCFLWQFIKYTFILYLSIRQHGVLKYRRRIPRALRGKIPPENFERARNYHMSLNYLKMFSCFYWIAHEFLLIFLAGFTGMWFLSGPILDRFLAFGLWNDDWDRETGESIIFSWILVLHVNIVQMPMHLYKTFGIEATYGFNKMSPAAFLWDWVKAVILEMTFGSVIGISILWTVQETGAYFFLWLWLFSFIWMMIYLAIYPNIIAPIFNTYSPLREGRLKTRLSKLAHFLGFPLEDILVLEQSWRSEHRKAYFYGLLGAKRIVIYDTLLAGYPEADPSSVWRREKVVPRRTQSLESMPSKILARARRSKVEDILGVVPSDTSENTGTPARVRFSTSRKSMYDTGFTEFEIEAIVARLMGKWILGHTIKELFYPVISMFLFYLIFSWVYGNSSLYHAFASLEKGGIDKPILLGLRLIYADVLDIYRIFVGWAMKYFSRQRYYDADAFATKLGYGDDLIDYYIEAEKENLEYPFFDSWYFYFHFDEPSILHSIEAIEKEIERMEWKNE